MVDHSGEEKIDDKYLESFKASDKKRKVLVVGIAVFVLLVLAAVFYRTIGSLSEMSNVADKAFQDNGTTPADPNAPIDPNAAPSGDSTMMRKAPEAETTPPPADGSMQKDPAATPENAQQPKPAADSTKIPVPSTTPSEPAPSPENSPEKP